MFYYNHNQRLFINVFKRLAFKRLTFTVRHCQTFGAMLRDRLYI